MRKFIWGIILLCSCFYVFASTDFQEGKHYQQVPIEAFQNELVQELKAKYPKKILVVEFFSYGCHWCHELEPHLKTWLETHKADYVEFVRIPVVFQSSWLNLSKAYYSAEQLGILDKFHAAMFTAIHEEKLQSSTQEALASFFETQGVAKKDFLKVFRSFGVEQQAKQANQLSMIFKITAIPTFVIQGENNALITSTRMVGGEAQVFDLISALVKEEHRVLMSVENSN
ncbi:MAG TPA: thiol:disulfide interchange protein DsbA/DsbL [Gammaproteobacteria bacterium]|nr:thiol:disulfide interchange protein DsbA/DsbL [Gammaproteobacteria bacterium]